MKKFIFTAVFYCYKSLLCGPPFSDYLKRTHFYASPPDISMPAKLCTALRNEIQIIDL